MENFASDNHGVSCFAWSNELLFNKGKLKD